MRRFSPAIAVIFLSTTSYALSYRSSEKEARDLALAAGITAPSAISAVYQNPAGLMFTKVTTLAAHVEYVDETFSSPGFGGAVLVGDGSYGAALGYQSGPSRGTFGLGVRSPEVNMSLGLIGTKDFDTGGATRFNLGVLIDPVEKLHVGLTYKDFLHSTREYGFGLGYDFAATFSVALDVAASRDFSAIWGCPGIIMRGANAALTLAYGFALKANSAAVTQIGEGAIIGGAFRPASQFNIEFYYRKAPAATSYGYYFGVSYAFN